jgi:hypothetical protein
MCKDIPQAQWTMEQAAAARLYRVTTLLQIFILYQILVLFIFPSIFRATSSAITQFYVLDSLQSSGLWLVGAAALATVPHPRSKSGMNKQINRMSELRFVFSRNAVAPYVYATNGGPAGNGAGHPTLAPSPYSAAGQAIATAAAASAAAITGTNEKKIRPGRMSGHLHQTSPPTAFRSPGAAHTHTGATTTGSSGDGYGHLSPYGDGASSPGVSASPNHATIVAVGATNLDRDNNNNTNNTIDVTMRDMATSVVFDISATAPQQQSL